MAEALGPDGDEDQRVAAVDESGGILADLPDWPDWLGRLRGGGAADRLKELGL